MVTERGVYRPIEDEIAHSEEIMSQLVKAEALLNGLPELPEARRYIQDAQADTVRWLNWLNSQNTDLIPELIRLLNLKHATNQIVTIGVAGQYKYFVYYFDGEYRPCLPSLSQKEIDKLRYELGEITEAELDAYIYVYWRYGGKQTEIHDTLDECFESAWATEESGEGSSHEIKYRGEVLYGREQDEDGNRPIQKVIHAWGKVNRTDEDGGG